VRLLLLADTHVPRRAKDHPAAVWAEVGRADLVVHAGDWTEPALLERLRSRADVLGCWGNNDGPEVRALLPEVAQRTVAGLRLGVVHETGDTRGRERRADASYHDLDVLVFGHSHAPWDSTTATGLRLLNPGSPTDRRRQPVATFMTAQVEDGVLREVQLHPVPR